MLKKTSLYIPVCGIINSSVRKTQHLAHVGTELTKPIIYVDAGRPVGKY